MDDKKIKEAMDMVYNWAIENGVTYLTIYTLPTMYKRIAMEYQTSDSKEYKHLSIEEEEEI